MILQAATVLGSDLRLYQGFCWFREKSCTLALNFAFGFSILGVPGGLCVSFVMTFLLLLLLAMCLSLVLSFSVDVLNYKHSRCCLLCLFGCVIVGM